MCFMVNDLYRCTYSWTLFHSNPQLICTYRTWQWTFVCIVVQHKKPWSCEMSPFVNKVITIMLFSLLSQIKETKRAWATLCVVDKWSRYLTPQTKYQPYHSRPGKHGTYNTSNDPKFVLKNMNLCLSTKTRACRSQSTIWHFDILTFSPALASTP